MRKRGMKILIGIAAAVALFVGIKFLYRHFITDRIMDGGTGMEDPAGPMLDYLSADWEEPCGWRVTIDGYQMEIFFSDKKIYQGSFSFSYSPGEDVNKKMQMYPDQNSFDSENGDFSGVIKELYTEDGMMYLDIKFDKYKQENGTRRQVVLNRVEYGKPAESESKEIREVSEMAELVEFSWNQITIGDSGFRFHIVCTGQDPIDPRLSCRYMDQEANKIIQIGDEGSIEACPTIPSARWEELADFLHKAELPAYREPDPRLTDDMEVHAVTFVSKIQVTWWDGGEEFTNSYDGTSADELLELLKDIARETNSQKSDQPKPAESELGEMRKVSEMAELVELSWHQSAMNYDGCFDFRITSSEQESAAPRLYCDYTDPETGERIEVGEECSGFQGFGLDGTRTDSAACPPVPLERWEELADFLHTAELSPYHSPEPGLMDATDSKIQVTWQEDGEKFTNSYSGIYAHELLKLLQNIAGEVSRGALEEAKPE